MADVHILDSDGTGAWNVEFHFPIPDATNKTGMSYRQALILSGLGNTVSRLPEALLGEGEAEAIASGALWEVPSVVRAAPTVSPAELQAVMASAFAGAKTAGLANLQLQLGFFGGGV